jgi:hypothetical protein
LNGVVVEFMRKLDDFQALGPEPTSFATNRTIGLTFTNLFARRTVVLTFNAFLVHRWA